MSTVASNETVTAADAERDALVTAYVEASSIEVPPELLEEEISRMLVEEQVNMTYSMLESGHYPSYFSESPEEQLEVIRAEATGAIKTRLVLERLIESEQLTVSSQELEEEARAIAQRQQISVEHVKDFLGEDLASLRADLLIRKALDSICAGTLAREH